MQLCVNVFNIKSKLCPSAYNYLLTFRPQLDKKNKKKMNINSYELSNLLYVVIILFINIIIT